jgi:DNA-binding MarR family transcriptional regulator
MSRRSRDDVLNDLGYQFRAMQTEFEDHDAAVARLLGLNGTDMRVLDFLGRTGDPSSFESAPTNAGDLARASGLTTGGVTAALDRLENAGWVRRRADPSDRRRVLVELTDKAVAMTIELYGPLKDRGAEMLKAYTVDELELFLRALRASRQVTTGHTEELLERIRRGEGSRWRDEAA